MHISNPHALNAPISSSSALPYSLSTRPSFLFLSTSIGTRRLLCKPLLLHSLFTTTKQSPNISPFNFFSSPPSSPPLKQAAPDHPLHYSYPDKKRIINIGRPSRRFARVPIPFLDVVWHVTRRDLGLVVTVLVLFSLAMQLDLNLRFTDARGTNSSLGLKLGLGSNRRTGPAWENSSARLGPHRPGQLTRATSSPEHDVPRVDEAKLKWQDDGAARTQVLKHAPGWTILDDIYLFNGTWYIVTDSPSDFPLRRMMISTGADIWNDQPSIDRRYVQSYSGYADFAENRQKRICRSSSLGRPSDCGDTLHRESAVSPSSSMTRHNSSTTTTTLQPSCSLESGGPMRRWTSRSMHQGKQSSSLQAG